MGCVNYGLVVERKAWQEKGYQCGLANDPVSGVAVLVLVQGTQLWSGYQPSKNDRTATDWQLAGNKPYSLLSDARREVL